MKKMYAAILIAALTCGTLFAGCGSKPTEDVQSQDVESAGGADNGADAGAASDNNGGSSDNGSANDNNFMDNLSNALQADGREYGQTYQLTQNDVMHSAFFDLKVNKVQTTDDLEDYSPIDEDYTFLIVNVSITNTFDLDDPMSNADFPVFWGAGADGEWCYPDTDFSTALPEQYNIAVGDTVEGDLIYTVPKDAGSVTIEYYDMWSDEFEGNTFDMVINY